MKAYLKDNNPTFLYPDQMKRILEYLEANGTLQIAPEQVEGYYLMFSEAHAAGWLHVNDDSLEKFADYLAELDVDPAHCQGDVCDL